MTPPTLTDVCYRCGYDLRTLADNQPCSECGLLAARSRRPTDELHHTRPGWLRRLAWGVWLILLAMATPFVGAGGFELLRQYAWNGVQSAKWTMSTYFAVVRHGAFLGADLAAVL